MHIAYATAPGSRHVNPGNAGKVNNQDAVAVITTENGAIAVICDGCGSQPHSEVGADFGANALARIVAKDLARAKKPEELDWSQIANNITTMVQNAAAMYAGEKYGPTFERVVTERFLFTALVLVACGKTAIIASFGDGIVVIDDKVMEIESPLTNAPVYMGYLLFPNNDYQRTELKEHLGFKVMPPIDLTDVEDGIIIGSDGLKDLLNEDLRHPALAQQKSLQRWLNTQTAERIHGGSFVSGKCRDDVTLVVVRTDEAQAKALESRRETVTLKQKIADMEYKVSELEKDIERMGRSNDHLRNMLGSARLELNALRPKTEPTVIKSGKKKRGSLVHAVQEVFQGFIPNHGPIYGTGVKFRGDASAKDEPVICVSGNDDEEEVLDGVPSDDDDTRSR